MSIGVGVIGAGTVGGGVIKTLLQNRVVIRRKMGAHAELKHVADVNTAPLSEFDLDGVSVSTDANALIDDPEVEVVCELIGGIEPAMTFILNALNAGKHVVTANKMLIATHGPELTEAAIANNVELRYEAAVAGAIPIIKALRESLAANHVDSVYGILNGTCNYILTRMALEGLEFEDALNQAVELGFAETPPDLDIEGHDTAHKCQIIASVCYSSPVDLHMIPVEGITKITHADVAYALDLGYLIKLLAIIREVDGEIEARVHPTLVPLEHLLASVAYEFNAIYVQSDIADATLYYGRGAGRMPTASAVVSDIMDILRRGNGPAPAPFVYADKRPLRSIDQVEGQYYLRLTTEDRPGVLGHACTVLGDNGVSIASCIQHEDHEPEGVHVVMMTHDTTESQIQKAVETIDAMDYAREPTHIIRVL